MDFDVLFAGVAVSDLKAAQGWYEHIKPLSAAAAEAEPPLRVDADEIARVTDAMLGG